jgi:hypothetical protein
MRKKLAFLAGMTALFSASMASAFCRTTTCDTTSLSCSKDDSNCTNEGIPIAWPRNCINYGIQVGGSDLRGIPASTVADMMDRAFAAWTDATCEAGGTPPITAVELGDIECNQPEFNCDMREHNANTVMFRDDNWPSAYGPSALAITTVTVNVNNGDILDADIELNSVRFGFSVGDTEVSNDLLSVITHEVGHLLGMEHELVVSGATMNPGYNRNDTSIRELHPDDIAGICDVYPPEASDATCAAANIPADTSCLGGLACPERVAEEGGGGCSLAAAPTNSPTRGAPSLFGAALCALFWLGRRRARS